MASPLLKLYPSSSWYGTLLITIISLFTITTPIRSQSDNTYIIHMDLNAMPKPFSDHHHWFLATLSSLPSSQPSTTPPTHIYTYTNSIHGFTAKLTSSQLETLKTLPGYVSSTKDRKLQLHTTHSPEFLGLDDSASSTTLYPVLNNHHGEGIIIGLVDTGIWPESDSFRDEGMASGIPSRWKGKCVSGTQFNSSLCNKKLIGAYFYNKGLLASHPEAKLPMNSPRDTDGHGTHTASIAAGNYVRGASYFGYAPGTARGIAPGARLAVYKAAWRYGTYASDIIAAVDQAIHDGVDVLSLSLGFSSEDSFFEDDVIAAATFAAVERGIFVTASAGNSGSLYNTAINGAPWLTTVGAGTLDRSFGGTLKLSRNGKNSTVPFTSLYPGKFSTNEREIVFLDGCASVEEMKKYKNNIIVCKDNLSISDQVENAQAAKVSGVVFITDINYSEFYTRSSIPAGYIGSKYGKIVTDYIKSSNVSRGAMRFGETIIGTKPEPRVDGYSGRGPFPSCPSVLKPDVIAPGTLILASWSPISSVATVGKNEVFSPFNIMSGTSMATPHVAGVAALIKNVHPDWSPAAIRSALMTTASALDNTGGPIKDASEHNEPADPFATGSGHINPMKALDPGLVYDATTDDYISLLCAMNFTAKQIQAITRSSSHKCGNKSSKVLDLNYPSFLAYFNSQDKGSEPKVVVREFRRTMTSVGDGAASYTAKLTPMKGVAVKVEPEKLVFDKKYEKLSYKLTVEGPKLLNDAVVHGSLSWVHDGGKYVVRSPIVATSIVPESPFS